MKEKKKRNKKKRNKRETFVTAGYFILVGFFPETFLFFPER